MAARLFRITNLLLAFLLAVSVAARAQLSTGTLFGNVTDATGAAIPGATVVLTQTQTNFTRTTKANGNGEYRAEFLPVGPYTATITAPGFNQTVQKNIVVSAAAEQAVNYTMQVGEASQTVEVTAEVPLVNLGNSTLGSQIDNREVDNLPIVDRNAYQLVALTPGVQSSTNENSIGFPMQHVIINGSSDNMVGQVTYYLDGGLNMTGVRNTGNVLPNPDAIDQFSVQTSNFSAQYGRTGAGVVSALTKSGTNDFHGSLFYFNRETNFNSNDYGQATRTPYHRNYFGGTTGGPVVKDKIFFFASMAGLRRIDPINYNTVVPDALQRAGNFSENLPTNTTIGSGLGACATSLSTTDKNLTTYGGRFIVCDPVTHQPIPGNRADLDPNYVKLLDPTAAAVLQKVPLPNTNNGSNRFIANRGVPNNSNEFLGKGDFQLIPAHRITLDYFQSNGALTQLPSGGNLPGWAYSNYTYRQQNANVSDVWTVSPRSVNQAWLNYTRMMSSRISTPPVTLAAFGSELNVQGPASLPDITVSNFFHLSNAISGPKTGSNLFGLRDVYSTTLGKHTLNAGGEIYLEKDVQYTNENNYGVFSFSNTTVPNSASGQSTYIQTGVAMADFLIGRPNSVSQDAPDFANESYINWGLFLQDDWRLLPNLTVNLGVRYDVQTAPVDNQRRVAVLRKGVQSTVSPNAILGQLFPGDPGVPDGGVPVNYNHISPRLGFTYDPYGQGKTVIHGGAGLFFDSAGGNEWALSQNFQPFSVRETNAFTHVSSMTHLYSTDPQDFPGAVSPFPYYYDRANPRYISPAQLVFVQDHMRWPYNIQANFGFQQQFTKDFAFGATYVGAFSRKIPLYIDNNAPILNTANPAMNTKTNYNCRRPYMAIPFASPTSNVCANPQPGSKYISNAYVITDSQTTNYHGLQVTATKRLSAHVSINAWYIWSKSMASASLQTTGNIGNSAATQPEDYYNLSLEKQLSDNDARHQANLALVWKPDYFSGFNRTTRTLLNGWTISTIINVRSGHPFNITSGNDDNMDGNNNDRPNIVPGQIPGSIPYTRSSILVNPNNQPRWFNTAAYCRIGSAGCPLGVGPLGLDSPLHPNSLIGPGYKDVDAAIFRDFRIWEQVRFQLRGEANNVLNMVNLNNPNTTLSSGNFGTITGAGSMRQIQVGGRILF